MTMASSLMRASVSLHSLSSNAWISNPKHFRSDEQISAKRLLPTSIHPVVSMDNADSKLETVSSSRRELTLAALMSTLIAANNISMARDAQAVSTSRRALRSEQIPIENYTTLPNGLKYYDVKVGSGPIAVTGSRVAVHYVAKWKGVTFQTSRQGLGVTGGTPYGFDVGASKYGIVLKGLDLGVEGMRVGGQRLLILPPELAYGDRGVQEIPPKATIEFNVELLSIKQTPFGSSVKVVEG